MRLHAASRVDARLAWCLAVFVLCVGLVVMYDANDGNTDAEIHFQQVRAMARHGSWAYVNDNSVAEILIRDSGEARGDLASQRGPDGRVYGHFGVYYVLTGVPLYWLGSAISAVAPGLDDAVRGTPYLIGHHGKMHDYIERIAVTAISPIFLAVAAASLFLAARRLGARRVASLLAALTYVYATFAGVLARHCGSDTMAAGLLALTFERVLAASTSGRRALWQAGAAAGVLMGTRYLALALLPGVAVVAWFVITRRSTHAETRRRERLRDAMALLTPPLLLFAAVFYWNWARWGSPLDFGYRHSFEDRTLTGNTLVQGAQGLLLSFFAPSRGLLFFAFPAIVLGFVGIAKLWRQDRLLAMALSLGVLTTALPPSLSPVLWHGSWSWGPRYHLGCLIFLAPAAAIAIDAALRAGRISRALTFGCILTGFLCTLPALVSSPFGFLFAANESLRIERPASSFADPVYRDNEALVEANRQETMLLAPPSSPYNAIRGQWRWFLHGLRGTDTVSVREFFGVDSDATLTPHLIEYGGFRSPWAFTMRARTGSNLGFLDVAVLLAVAAASAVALVRGCNDDDPVTPTISPSSQRS